MSIEHKDGRFLLSDVSYASCVRINKLIVPNNKMVSILPYDIIEISESTSLKIISDYYCDLPSMIGKIIDNRYYITDIIHQSEKAVVYNANERPLQRPVIIKVLSPKLASYVDYAECFLNEAKVTAGLRHPNICKILTFGPTTIQTESGNKMELTYLCMELMEGGTLADYVRKSERISLQKVADWTNDLGHVFDYIHGKGVVHAGVKPSSIVFDLDSKVYLTDFSLARISGIRTITPAFAAPEQWAAKEPTSATDQFSLAVVIYRLIAGELPYEHNGKEDERARQRNFLRGPDPAHEVAVRQGWDNVPSTVSKVLAKALSNDPKDRYETVGKFASELVNSILDRSVDKPKAFISYPRKEGVLAIIDLFLMITICLYGDLQIPKPGGNAEKGVNHHIEVVSYPMHQAVKMLHASDRMFNGNPDGGMNLILLFLIGG